MARSLFGWTNYASSGALSAGSNAANMAIGSGWSSDQGSSSTAWQTVTGVVTSAGGAYARIDAGAVVNWRAFVLARTNLTAAATVRWRVGSVADMSSGVVYDSGTVLAGIVAGIGQSVIVAPSDQAARYCQVEINDAANPDTFINIPLAFAGPVWVPSVGADWQSSFGRDDRVDEVITLGGQEYPIARWLRRHWSLALTAISAGEVWAAVMPLDQASRRGGNVLYIPDTASADIAAETVLGRMKPTSDLTYTASSTTMRSYRAQITERL